MPWGERHSTTSRPRSLRASSRPCSTSRDQATANHSPRSLGSSRPSSIRDLSRFILRRSLQNLAIHDGERNGLDLLRKCDFSFEISSYPRTGAAHISSARVVSVLRTCVTKQTNAEFSTKGHHDRPICRNRYLFTVSLLGSLLALVISRAYVGLFGIGAIGLGERDARYSLTKGRPDGRIAPF